MPAKLRVDGVDKPLRCEAHVDDEMVRLTATLPFLRLDGGVDVVLGEQGAVAAAGTIRKISRRSRRPPTGCPGWPSTSRSTTRSALAPSATERRARGAESEQRPPRGARSANPATSRHPPAAHEPAPACGQPLPSVVVAAGLARDQRAVEARPPRRRVHGTADIARRPEVAAWALRPAAVMATRRSGRRGARHPATDHVGDGRAAWSRARWVALPVVAAGRRQSCALHLSH